MKTFEDLLDALNASHTQKLEKKFEKEIVNQILYYYEEMVMPLDDELFIPVFTSEEEARFLPLDDAQMYAGYITDIPNPKGYEYVLNPANQAIVFDDSIWLQGSFEVISSNSTELGFMLRSKAFYEDTHVKEAYLVNVKIDGKPGVILVLDTMPEAVDTQNEFITKLQGILEGTSVIDIYSLEDKDIASMIKGMKPYYKKINA